MRSDAGPSGRVEANRAQQAANIAGVWHLTTVGPDGDKIEVQLTLKREGDSWKGTITSDAFDAELETEGMKLDGENATFQIPTPIGTYKVTANITSDKFSGTAVDPDGTKNPIKGGR